MAVLANVLNVTGLLFLSHAIYSAYEHSLLPSSSTPSASSSFLPRSLDPKINLPLDVTLETLFSVIILCIGVVMSSPDLMPIQWNVWAGRLERSKEARVVKEVGLGGGNPYAVLEDRPGFVDIRKQKRQFAEWAKDGGVALKSST